MRIPSRLQTSSVFVFLGGALISGACSTGDGGPGSENADGTESKGSASGDGDVASGGGTSSVGGGVPVDVQPLYDESTVLEPENRFDRGDAIITRFADRARDRHAREDQFQQYDHYLSHYWVHRTARFIFTDYVSKGGSTIDISFVAEWKLDDPPELRIWYSGNGSASYHGNVGQGVLEEGPGLYDAEHVRIGDGEQYKYTYTVDQGRTLAGDFVPLAVGQFMEVEPSQFLDAPPTGRDNYYGTAFLYEVGVGGMVPWYADPSDSDDSKKIPDKGWLGGRTTLPYQYSDEPDNHFMQMATNLAPQNGQPFVRGRRIHHTNMIDGSHDESDDNPTFEDLVGISGTRYINATCDGCHKRNGRAPVAGVGEPLDLWVFKVGEEDGSPDALIGSVLQPNATSGSGEGNVAIAEWIESDGLRSPRYSFSDREPASFSARLAPQLVGLGLLEAIPEATILEAVDPQDADGDGVSGRANVVIDPETGFKRLGRFGYKAGASSLRHQISAALNTDMGVATSVLPELDCGSAQEGCDQPSGPELSDEHLDDLVRYVALLGVRARRSLDDAQALRGEEVFSEIGCATCHRTELQTSPYHPFAELRDQTIRPFTDLLLHDMGEGLADSLGEGEATGAEWRTAPLWGLGLAPCVTGGVEGPAQDQSCTPHESYLHDGRARTLEEAILWHGGEGEDSRAAFEGLSTSDRDALIVFLRSL